MMWSGMLGWSPSRCERVISGMHAHAGKLLFTPSATMFTILSCPSHKKSLWLAHLRFIGTVPASTLS